MYVFHAEDIASTFDTLLKLRSHMRGKRISIERRFDRAVSGIDLALCDSLFPKIVPLLKRRSRKKQTSGRLLARCAQSAFWKPAHTELVEKAARRWAAIAPFRMSARDQAYYNLACGILSSLKGETDDTRAFLETASHLGYVIDDLACVGYASQFTAQRDLWDKNFESSIVNARHAAKMLNIAQSKAAAVEATLLEAKGQLMNNNPSAAKDVLSAIFACEAWNTFQEDRLRSLVSLVADRGDREKRFLVALSFSSEVRDKARMIAETLGDHFGRECVLFDEFHRGEFARPAWIFTFRSYIVKTRRSR